MVVSLNNPIIIFFTFILFSIGLSSCDNDGCIKSPDVSSIEISVEIERLDKVLHKISTKNELAELLSENTVFAEEFLNLSQYPSPKFLVDHYFKLLNDRNIDSLFI